MPLKPHPGSLVAYAIVALVAGGFIALASVDGGRPALLAIGPYLTRVLLFSLAQAALSTMLSIAFGILLALALARRRFPGREAVLAMLGTTMVMPSIVAVLAVLSVYGRNGWLAEGLRALGWTGEFSIYGYPGILIAHVFLNAPFVARIVLDGLSQTPAEQWRLAADLGVHARCKRSGISTGRFCALKFPGLASLVFLSVFKSFAIVLALGGGPSRATLEVAIYEALKIELDFTRAAWLALIQLAICLSVTLLLNWTFVRPLAGATNRSPVPRPDAGSRGLKALDSLLLLLSAAFLVPLLLSIMKGARYVADILDADLIAAFGTSLTIAIAAAIIACVLAWALAAAARQYRLRTARSSRCGVL